MYELMAYSGRYIWVTPAHPGRPEYGPFLLPDGTDADQLVADGNTDRLEFTPVFRRQGGGQQIGDLLWTLGSFSKIASQRFVDALQSINATGYHTFDIELTDGRRRPMHGFVGFAVDLDAPADADIRPPANGVQFWSFYVTDTVMDALRQAGATRFRHQRV